MVSVPRRRSKGASRHSSQGRPLSRHERGAAAGPLVVRAGADPAEMAAEHAPGPRSERVPRKHRTVDRVTRILEEVVYKPGMTFAELVRVVDAPKSSVHGFIRGLLANGWLYETQRRFYLGPAVYGLTLASGHIRAGMVTHGDLAALQAETGVAVFIGIKAGDHLIYIAQTGSDPVAGFDARSNIRRTLLVTAGGKALLATCPDAEREAYLRRCGANDTERVSRFLGDLAEIRRTRIATNVRHNGARYAIATVLRNQSGEVVAAITLVGATVDMKPRTKKLCSVLLRHVDAWSKRLMLPREAI